MSDRESDLDEQFEVNMEDEDNEENIENEKHEENDDDDSNFAENSEASSLDYGSSQEYELHEEEKTQAPTTGKESTEDNGREASEVPHMAPKAWEGYIRIKVPSSFAPASEEKTVDNSVDGDEEAAVEDEDEYNEEKTPSEAEDFESPAKPYASIDNPPLKDARVYFPKSDKTFPPWLPFLLNDDVHFLERLLNGKPVNDSVLEVDDDELDNDNKKGKKGKKGAKKKNKKKKKQKKEVEKKEVEYDDDGHVIIPQPLEGSLRFRLIQLTHSQELDNNDPIEVTDDELVFIAYMMDPSEVEAEVSAYEAEGPSSMMPPPTGRASAVLPPIVAKSVQELHPKRNNVYSEPNNGNNGEDGEDEHISHQSYRTNNNDDEDDEDIESDRRHSSTYDTSPAMNEDEEDQDRESEIAPLELRMDLTTLMALRCPWALQRALMTHGPLPSMANVEAWIEILCESCSDVSNSVTSTLLVDDDQTMPDEYRIIVRNLVEATRLSLEAKKPNPSPSQQIPKEAHSDEEYTIPRVDVDEGYDGDPEGIKDHSTIPPVAPYAIIVDNCISIPKIQMQLGWTFVKEAHFPNLTKELRYLRRELLQVARVAPSMPILPSSVCKEHTLVESYVEFLMTVPRSVLKSWIMDVAATPEEQIMDISEITISPEEYSERPLSSMLGRILLDLRTRESRRANLKRDLRLAAFAAHKSYLTYTWMESNTVLDPLVTSEYAVNQTARKMEMDKEESYKVAMKSLLTSLRAKRNGEVHNSKMKTTTSTASSEQPKTWPHSLRLYDSDLVAFACAKYGVLDTFQEILRIKSNITRHMDDTIGTYNLLFKLLPSLHPSCASFLVEFAANHVPHIPIMTSASTITPFDCMDCSLAIIGAEIEKSNLTSVTVSPKEIATNFWARWIGDDTIMQALKSSAPSIYEEVESEASRSRLLKEAVRGCTITPLQLEGKVRKGDMDSSSSARDAMHRRDVISPIILYEAVVARNIPIIVHLVKNKVLTTKQSQEAAEVPLIDLLLEDDKQREIELSKKSISEMSTAELLASKEDKAEGILSILIALVDVGLSLEGVLSAGNKGIMKQLSDRYSGLKKYKKLIRLWTQKEHERNTDHNYMYGLLKYLPQDVGKALPASKRIIQPPLSARD